MKIQQVNQQRFFKEDSFDRNQVDQFLDNYDEPISTLEMTNTITRQNDLNSSDPRQKSAEGYAGLVHTDASGSAIKQNLSNFKQPSLTSKQILNIYKQSQVAKTNDEELLQRKRLKQVKLSEVSEERGYSRRGDSHSKTPKHDISPISGYSGSQK